MLLDQQLREDAYLRLSPQLAQVFRHSSVASFDGSITVLYSISFCVDEILESSQSPIQSMVRHPFCYSKTALSNDSILPAKTSSSWIEFSTVAIARISSAGLVESVLSMFLSSHCL